ncbi:type VI secretion system baseplate subunit TssE [Xanthobacter oligotrophicus]|uniref:type VI secretion system baseplate subunit TssE n=1 Tax=Xanthobacter oligotrophicus TaxID=2607286 RepID=UPI0011F162C2|nr:type VI secretion system baseplate subunit TssE [Xanthobacter oligotrophicus]MCG5233960.1 type VI secretion system baseplate subunit TssE [Xanthobacter oligotrophicus]
MHAFRAAFVARDARQVLDERDESGLRVIAGRRAAARASVNETVLRAEVVRDVETMLNTINLGSTQNLAGLDEVPRSILNFGIPDIVHRTIDEEGLVDVVDEIETALACFEPRILARTLDVRWDPSVEKHELKIRFLITAEMILNEQNIEVEFVADIALDSGKILVNPV